MFRTDIKKNYRTEIKVINEAKIKCYRSSQEERFPASIWEEKSSQMFLMVVAYYLVASFTKRRKGIPIGAEYPGGEVQSTLSNRRARRVPRAEQAVAGVPAPRRASGFKPRPGLSDL